MEKTENLPFDLKNSEKTISDIKKNPILLSKFYIFLFESFNKIDITKFKKNIQYLSKKIESLTKENENEYDMYISLSCIFGAFFGDSLGSHCEFLNASPKNSEKIYTNNRFQNGQITDDSEMAMSKAFAIMDMPDINDLDQNLLFYYYGIWISSKPLDKGITIKKALNFFDIEKMPINEIKLTNEIIKNIKDKNSNSKANGALMRISTFIVWFYYKKKDEIKDILNSNDKKKFYDIYKDIYNDVSKDVVITHPNKENIVSCSIFSFMTLCVMNGFDGKTTIEKLKKLLENFSENKESSIKNKETSNKNKESSNKNKDSSNKKKDSSNKNEESSNKDEATLKKIIEDALKAFGEKTFNKVTYFSDVGKNIGYYIHAFKLSLYYLTDERILNKKENAYLNIIEEICNFGGDTDTNAAIVGTLIGPLIGYTKFTKNIVYKTFIEFCSEKRILYTSILMYFFVKYLDENFKKNSEKKNLEKKIENKTEKKTEKKKLENKIENKTENKTENKKEIKYNFLKIFLEMINDDLSKKIK